MTSKTRADDHEPSIPLRAQHAEATRRALISAARSLFGAQGYAQTSIEEIVASARVTKGALYHHFPNKEALFRAVYSEVEAEARARAGANQDLDSPPIDQIVGVVDAYLEVALDPEIRRVTLVDGPTVLGLEPEGPAEQDPGHLDFRSFVAAAIEAGQLADLDPDLLARVIEGLALLGGLVIARVEDRQTARVKLGEILELMLRSLAPKRRR